MDKVPEEIRSDFLQLVQKGAISEPVFAAFGKYLEALVENSPFCVLVADSEGKLVMSNSASEKMFGTKLPSMMSRWIQSTPACSAWAISSASREKSAFNMDADMSCGFMASCLPVDCIDCKDNI